MSAAYFAGDGRPAFNPDGRLVVRRALTQGDKMHQIGEEMPRLDLTTRQIAMLWEQGWIDTLPLEAPPKGKGKPAASELAR